MAVLGYLTAICLIAFFLNVTVMWLLARWLGAERSRYRDAMVVGGFIVLINLACLPLDFGLANAIKTAKGAPLAGFMMLSIVLLVVTSVIAILATRRCLRTTFWRATAITVGAGVVVILFAFFVPQLLVQGFAASTASMAPTLTGQHYTAPCPICRKTLIVPESIHQYGPIQLNETVGICEQFHMVKLQDLHGPTISIESSPNDRFFVDKTAMPGRWDLAVFRHPQEPETIYVKRLVGLPGEEIIIKDGSAWANGEKLTPPPELQGLTYSRGMMGPPDKERPCQLGDDEYFMLGDFTDRSSDSRYWGPVKKAAIIGTVTLRYWPLSRWKVFR